MLNISARREKTTISPSVVNNVNVNTTGLSNLNHIPKQLPKRITQRCIKPVKRDISIEPTDNNNVVNTYSDIDDSIKIINNDGSTTTYNEVNNNDYNDGVVIYGEHQDVNNDVDVKDNNAVVSNIDNKFAGNGVDNEVDVLQKYISLLREHNIIKADKLILSPDELANIVLLITQADEVNITLNNDIGCISIGKFIAIENIYIIKNNTRNDFKLFYPSQYAYLRDLKIDLKHVSK